MFKKEFIESIEAVVNGSKNAFKNDKGAIRLLFSTMLDNYSRDGLVTDSQAQNWILTQRELNKLIKISKG
jgi:hypothetical protein